MEGADSIIGRGGGEGGSSSSSSRVNGSSSCSFHSCGGAREQETCTTTESGGGGRLSSSPETQAGSKAAAAATNGTSAQGFGPEEASGVESEAAAEQMESTYVHQVYDAIAPHFSATRFAIWPKVSERCQV